MNTIYECTRDGVKEFHFLTPERVKTLKEQGWTIRKVRKVEA